MDALNDVRNRRIMTALLVGLLLVGVSCFALALALVLGWDPNAADGAESPREVQEIPLQWPGDLDTGLTECAQEHEGSTHAVVPLIHEDDGVTVTWGDVECYGTS